MRLYNIHERAFIKLDDENPTSTVYVNPTNDELLKCINAEKGQGNWARGIVDGDGAVWVWPAYFGLYNKGDYVKSDHADVAKHLGEAIQVAFYVEPFSRPDSDYVVNVSRFSTPKRFHHEWEDVMKSNASVQRMINGLRVIWQSDLNGEKTDLRSNMDMVQLALDDHVDDLVDGPTPDFYNSRG